MNNFVEIQSVFPAEFPKPPPYSGDGNGEKSVVSNACALLRAKSTWRARPFLGQK